MDLNKFIRSIIMSIIIVVTGVMGLVSFYFYIIQDTYMIYSDQDIQSNWFGVNVSEIKNNKVDSIDEKCNKEYKVSLFGVIPIKKIQVRELDKIKVTPCGTPFGVKLLTDGVMIIDIRDVFCVDENRSPAREAGLKVGDVIISVDGNKVSSNSELKEFVSLGEGKLLRIKYKRNFEEYETKLKPAYSLKDEKWLAGLWVRDSSAGIGTITFCTENGIFGGLGHPICDVDTGNILPLGRGEIVSAYINDVKNGASGSPGELCGIFSNNEAIGNVKINDNCGLFGKLIKPINIHEPVLIGLKQEVRIGKATIYSTIFGDVPQSYDIEIESIDFKQNNRNYVVRITDQKLLKKTGGIVQGMSGSPIIQDGKLIGAVTHVFVNDPTRGYGVFAETMIEKSNKLLNFN